MGDRCAAFLQKKGAGGKLRGGNIICTIVWKVALSFKGLKDSGNYMYHILFALWLQYFIVIPKINKNKFPQNRKLIGLKNIYESLSEVEIFISFIYKLDKFLDSTGCVVA